MARNTGIALASGEFILPLDCDDLISNTYTEEAVVKFLENERQQDKLKVSWIQNELDNIAKLLYSTKYKLINLG